MSRYVSVFRSAMKLALLPGTGIATARQTLEECRINGVNVRGKGSEPDVLLSDYLLWCRTSADRLVNMIGPKQIDTLFLTATYWAMLNVQQARGPTT